MVMDEAETCGPCMSPWVPLEPSVFVCACACVVSPSVCVYTLLFC